MSIRLGTDLLAGTPDISGLADRDLSNLTGTGKNIWNWSSNVSNCITCIPQDIKLELSSGVLTLKAGSKLYIPNGFEQDGTTPHFDSVTISADIQNESHSGTKTVMISYDPARNQMFAGVSIDSWLSGTTNPTTGNGYFYNTQTNIIDYHGGSTYEGATYAFPLAIARVDSGYVSYLDNVFNGFGYVGSTIFALPGIKTLLPNGKNNDGSLKSIEVTTSTVLTKTLSSGDGPRNLGIDSSSIDFYSPNYYYDGRTNLLKRIPTGGGGEQYYNVVLYGNCYLSSGIISNFNTTDGFALTNDFGYSCVCDGPWINAGTQNIASNVSITATGSKDYSLADYLPKDNYAYEVLCSVNARTGTTSGNTIEGGISSSLSDTAFRSISCKTNTAAYNVQGAFQIVPIGTDRKISFRTISINGTATIVFFRAHGYRRIGTNL